MKRFLLWFAIVLGVTCTPAILADGPDIANAAPSNSLKPRLAGQLAVPRLWQSYKARFVSGDGRVIDDANGNISHSEGQGYGLLLSVAADDPATFKRIWDWTQVNLMLRPDGLASWKWDPAATPRVQDRNDASDGDILIAWALIEAGEAWDNQAYRAAGKQLADAIASRLFVQKDAGWILKPGVDGFGTGDRADGPLINLSYWVFPAIERLAEVEGGHWAALSASGLRLIEASRFGTDKLPTDWVSLKAITPEPAAGMPPTFGYNAIRVPLYLAWARAGQRQHLAPFAALWSRGVPAVINVTNGETTEPLSSLGYQSVSALMSCAMEGQRIADVYRTAPPDNYYPTTLRLLVLISVHQRYPECW